MALTHTMTVPAAPQAVADLLCSERYCLENQRSRDDVVDCSYEPVDDTDEALKFNVHTVHYKRKKTGKLDRSATENSTTEYRYDKGRMEIFWQHVGDAGSRVNVNGTTRVVPAGSSTRIDRVVTIDINIPVIGRGISKLVEKEFRKGFGRMEQVIHRLIAEGA